MTTEGSSLCPECHGDGVSWGWSTDNEFEERLCTTCRGAGVSPDDRVGEVFTVSYMLRGRRIDSVWHCYRDAAYFADAIDEGDVDALLLGAEENR